jgi:hypothetical protein
MLKGVWQAHGVSLLGILRCDAGEAKAKGHQLPLNDLACTILWVKRLTTPTLKIALPLLTSAVCIAALFAPFVLRHHAPFIMDELVDMQLAVQIDRGVKIYSEQPFERTPLMTYLLAWAHDPATSSFQSAVNGRFLASLATQLTALGILATAVRVLSWRFALLAVLLAVTFTDFLDQSFRIRADVFSTMFALPAFYIVCSPRLGRVNVMLAGLALGLALVTTQKAIYFAVAFGLAVAARCLFDLRALPIVARVRSLASLGAGTALGAALPLASLFVWAATTDRWQGFVENCLLHGAKVGLIADSYSFTTQYVWQSLDRNPVFWALGLLGLVGMLWWSIRKGPAEGATEQTESRRSQQIGLGVWTAVLLLMFWQHTAKFPYIFVNLTPCLAVCGAWALAQFRQVVWRDRWPELLAITCCGGLVAAMLHIWPHYQRNRNNTLIVQQWAVMERVDAITAPDDAVFDGIGMATTRVHAVPYSLTKRFFDERRAGANYPIIPFLVERQPKVAIENYRWGWLSADEKAYLATHFVQDWSNVWVAGARIVHPGPEKSEHTIHLAATTEYTVLVERPTPVTIDGRRVGAKVQLSVGMHTVSVEGEAQQVVLKYARAVDTPTLAPTSARNLYPSYSD